jgi:hypothetical protein
MLQCSFSLLDFAKKNVLFFVVQDGNNNKEGVESLVLGVVPEDGQGWIGDDFFFCEES